MTTDKERNDHRHIHVDQLPVPVIKPGNDHSDNSTIISEISDNTLMKNQLESFIMNNPLSERTSTLAMDDFPEPRQSLFRKSISQSYSSTGSSDASGGRSSHKESIDIGIKGRPSESMLYGSQKNHVTLL